MDPNQPKNIIKGRDVIFFEKEFGTTSVAKKEEHYSSFDLPIQVVGIDDLRKEEFIVKKHARRK